VLAASVVPAALMPYLGTHAQLLACGFFLGLPLAAFSAGVGFVSGWYPPHKQGLALGVYGAGNIGRTPARFGAPFLVAAAGYP
jgi:NNP family nitrate/nitrite transporter-like MFS transporter